ncbi:uncharacterized protein LOC133796278 [Humulus lupulus]|uniref:uncharacterized protein LOC133796278 n=1 Tax=Humulus lupulus TaxID=3486 RepID=UPI002B40B4F2|nr:uncharacterized protein LOC133796278 [Humulus lupulus]
MTHLTSYALFLTNCITVLTIQCVTLSIFKKLGLGKVNPTTLTFQLVDRSFVHLPGVIEDLLVKVDKFLFPTDFLILDMEEDHEIPLILSCLFLATGGALIDVQAGHATLQVNEEDVQFDIYNSENWLVAVNTCKRVDTLITLPFSE